MFQIVGLRERMKQIISVSYAILCNKITKGSITIENEASLQMQFGVILAQVGKLYEFSKEEHFAIKLETNKEIDPSTKSSNGKARCDIYLSLTDDSCRVSAAIEIKCFITKDNKPSKPTTNNRFSVLMDIENLERYKGKDDALLGYEFVYSHKGNYHNPDTRSDIKLVGELPKSYTYRGDIVNIKSNYNATWANNGNHHFLMIDLENIDKQ